jgi:hypothetical protein
MALKSTEIGTDSHYRGFACLGQELTARTRVFQSRRFQKGPASPALEINGTGADPGPPLQQGAAARRFRPSGRLLFPSQMGKSSPRHGHNPEGPANRLQGRSLLQEADYSSRRYRYRPRRPAGSRLRSPTAPIVICQMPLPPRSSEHPSSTRLA